MSISEAPKYEFFSQLARIINSGQARSIVLSGNVNDLFFRGDSYVPLVPFLMHKTSVAGLIQVVYELNGPVRVKPSCAKLGQLGRWASKSVLCR